MLDNNTNKVVWIGVAVGIVSLLGIVSLSLFPSAMDIVKPAIRDATLAPFAGYQRLSSGNNYHLTYAKNYNPAWNSYWLKLHSDVIEMPAHSYGYFEVTLTPAGDTKLSADVNNSVNKNTGSDGNDFDDTTFRKATLTEDGKALSHTTSNNPWWINKLQYQLKAGHTYVYGIYLKNDRDVPIYFNDTADITLILQPNAGLGDDKPFDMKVTNYRTNVINF